MNFKIKIKEFVEQLTGIKIYDKRTLPLGIEFFYDITRYLPKTQIDIVFDVGSNVGQSAIKYMDWFSKSQIYCFEPTSDTFRELQKSVKGNRRVHCFQLAFGSTKGKGQIVKEGDSTMFYLLKKPKDDIPKNCEEVTIATIDDFCHDKNIVRIGYLKIDTEGYDSEVLKGAESMLSQRRIDIVEVEAGMSFRNKKHFPLEIMKEFLESKNYFLFGFYEQVSEWPTAAPNLRRTNAVFISDTVIKINTRTKNK